MSLHRRALMLAALGIHVFPLLPRSKEPAVKTGFKVATSDPAQVEAWWGRNPAFNLGVATGTVSGFWVLDLDGPEAFEALATLEAEHGAVPITPMQLTGKGRHYLFAWNADRPVRNMSKRSREKVGAGIDVRGDGGYIVAAPSIHPSGRAYEWGEGRAPGQLLFAAAPAWLLDLVSPIPEPQASPAPAARRVRPPPGDGRATPYGEKSLDNACFAIRQARAGTRNDTLFLKALGIGQLVGGGEITSESYALDALRSAGRDMCGGTGSGWTDREEDTLTRGFRLGLAEPKSAPERHGHQPVQSRQAPAASAAVQASAVQDARGLWASARPAWVTQATDWLRARGLEPSATDALSEMRAHARAPWGNGYSGPALLAPLRQLASDPVEALAILPLHPRCERFEHFLGDVAGKVFALGPLDGGDPLVVTLDLQDAWRLVQSAPAKGFKARAVVAPALDTFSGGVLGDRFGRIDPATPLSDPDRPPWRLSDQSTVYLAVRRDIVSPELRARCAAGGTRRFHLDADAAARFYGSLAEQAWRRAGANAVRLLAPRSGAGFNDQGRA